MYIIYPHNNRDIYNKRYELRLKIRKMKTVVRYTFFIFIIGSLCGRALGDGGGEHLRSGDGGEPAPGERAGLCAGDDVRGAG